MSNIPSTQPRRLGGGSAAAEALNSQSDSSSFFKDGVHFLYPTDKKVGLTVRIKPAHDLSQLGKPSFNQSYVPYRTAEVDGQTSQPKFSSWMVPLRLIQRLGNVESLSFVSPATRRSGDSSQDDPALTRCPVFDLCGTAKRNKDRWGYLMEKPTAEQNRGGNNKFAKANLVWPGTSYAINVDYVTNEQRDPQNAVMLLSMSAFDYLQIQLNAYRAPNQPAYFPQSPFNHYLLDDVTNPMACRLAWVQKHRTSAQSNAEPWCIMFTKAPQVADGLMDAHPLTAKDLESRYDITSEDVIDIPSYQYIVDRISDAGIYPRELLVEACSNFANIGQPQSTGMTQEHRYNGAEDNIPMQHAGDNRPPQGFGAPQSQPQGFGAPQSQPQGFGAPAAAPQGFGAQPQSFGAPVNPQGFGAPAAAPQGFGAPQSQPQGFGAPQSQPQGFGAPQSQPQGFGAPAAAPQGFGAQPQGFGAPAAAPQGFGAPAAAPQGFGAPAAAPQGFGAPAAAPQGFGAPAAAPQGFGAPAAAPQGFAPTQPMGVSGVANSPAATNLAPSSLQPSTGEQLFWVKKPTGVMLPSPVRLSELNQHEPNCYVVMAVPAGHPQPENWEALSAVLQRQNGVTQGAVPPAPVSAKPQVTATQMQRYQELYAKVTTPGNPSPTVDELKELGELTTLVASAA